MFGVRFGGKSEREEEMLSGNVMENCLSRNTASRSGVVLGRSLERLGTGKDKFPLTIS